MPYQMTSAEAYDSIRDCLNSKQNVIFWAFRSQGNKTNAEMSEFLGWPINTVTPRVVELRKLRIIEAKGVKIGPTGRRAIVWGVV